MAGTKLQVLAHMSQKSVVFFCPIFANVKVRFVPDAALILWATAATPHKIPIFAGGLWSLSYSVSQWLHQ
jgi:hypothetical protein